MWVSVPRWICLVACWVLGTQMVAASDGTSLTWAVFLKSQCDKHVPGFAARAREPYERLRQRYAAQVAELEAGSPAGGMQSDVPLPDSDLDQLRSQCESMLAWMREDGLPPDPRLATPERTWNLFLGALRSGDKDLLADCLHASARERFLSGLMQMSRQDMVSLANSFKSFHLTKASTTDYQEAVVERSDGMAGFLLFVKTPRGWRISQL